MLGMVFGVPSALGALAWFSYRSAAARAQRGELLTPPGVERWEARDRP
jgi:hypothetical protein